MNSLELDILYRDERYIAVDKPPGLLVHKSSIDASETVYCLQLLRDQIGTRVYPCHRLDKPTSGVLLFALDKEALARMNALFEERSVRKSYVAIVRGWPEPAGTVSKPLKIARDYLKSGKEPTARQAQTDYKVLRRYELDIPDGRFPTSRYALVELHPLTGRMHQLRRHMQSVSHPIIGDTRYGKGSHNRLFREQFNSHRLLLHARALRFKHPFEHRDLTIQSDREVDFSIPLPVVD